MVTTIKYKNDKIYVWLSDRFGNYVLYINNKLIKRRTINRGVTEIKFHKAIRTDANKDGGMFIKSDDKWLLLKVSSIQNPC